MSSLVILLNTLIKLQSIDFINAFKIGMYFALDYASLDNNN